MTRAEELYETIMKISEPRNAGKAVWEVESWTEKTARLPLEHLIWGLCKPDKELANEVYALAKKKFEEAHATR